MKYTYYSLLIVIITVLMTDCADDSRLEYSVNKPESIAQLEYLNQYDVLKSYIDRTANPNFKLGLGVSVGEFTKKELVYSLVSSNFDEMTAGWEMKHGAVVQANGSLNLTNVENFVAVAKEAGIGIYGHTLCWHANQNAKYLNSLLEPIIIPGNSVPTWDVVTSADFETDNASNYQYNQNAIVSFTPIGGGSDGKGRAIKITNELVRTNDWDCQFFVTFSPSMQVGEKYELSMDVKSDVATSFATQAHVVPYQYKFWDFFGTINSTTSWTTFTKQITVTQDLLNTGTIAFNLGKTATSYYFDNIKLKKYNESGSGSAGYAYTFTNPTVTNFWSAQVAYDLNPPLDMNVEYVLKFVVKATTAGTIRAEIQSTADYSSNSFGTFNISKEWTEYELKTKATKADRNRFVISFGDYAGTVYIDNITLAPVGSSKSLIEGGDFENGATGWMGWGNNSTRGLSAEGEGYGGPGDIIIEKTPEQKKEIITNELERWIKGVMEVTKDYVKAWDVVNEPMSDWPDPSQIKTGIGKTNMAEDEFYWQDYMGKDYARKAIEFARKYGGSDMKLFINDYGLESISQAKCQGLIKYIEYLESDDVTKIDGIGTQMHVTLKSDATEQATQEEAISKMFKSLAGTGKLVKISELDMGIQGEDGNNIKTENATFEQLQRQANFYEFILKSYFENVPAAQRYGITQWAATDSPTTSSWRAGEPIGLWTLNYNRKPAYGGFANGLAGKKIAQP